MKNRSKFYKRMIYVILNHHTVLVAFVPLKVLLGAIKSFISGMEKTSDLKDTKCWRLLSNPSKMSFIEFYDSSENTADGLELVKEKYLGMM